MQLVDQMARLVPVSGIRPEHIDQELLVRAVVVSGIQALTLRVEFIGVRLQERMTGDPGCMPRTLECFFDGPAGQHCGKICAEIRVPDRASRGK